MFAEKPKMKLMKRWLLLLCVEIGRWRRRTGGRSEEEERRRRKDATRDILAFPGIYTEREREKSRILRGRTVEFAQSGSADTIDILCMSHDIHDIKHSTRLVTC